MGGWLYHKALYLTADEDEAAIIRTTPSMIRISREEMFIDEGKVRPKGSSTSKGGTMQQEDFVYRVPPTTRKPIGGMWPPLLLAVLVIECLLASWKQRFAHVLNNSWPVFFIQHCLTLRGWSIVSSLANVMSPRSWFECLEISMQFCSRVF